MICDTDFPDVFMRCIGPTWYRQHGEERLASDLDALSLSMSAVRQDGVGEQAGGGQEEPLDSLLASAAQPAGGEVSSAQQANATHTLY